MYCFLVSGAQYSFSDVSVFRRFVAGLANGLLN